LLKVANLLRVNELLLIAENPGHAHDVVASRKKKDSPVQLEQVSDDIEFGDIKTVRNRRTPCRAFVGSCFASRYDEGARVLLIVRSRAPPPHLSSWPPAVDGIKTVRCRSHAKLLFRAPFAPFFQRFYMES
jgi:hypothetical protein